MSEKRYQIDGMCCENCITHVKGALESLPEITHLQVQIASPQVTLELKDDVSAEKIIETINNAGHYSATEIE